MFWQKVKDFFKRSKNKGWTMEAILPSNYNTPEEWEAFKRSVDKVTREAANHTGGSFHGRSD
ncbi:MAG: hypothetical protein NTX00_01270 [Candidatus Parcubacteria bacterium]|nr:hypothetical protein [Candidatus Parcubacteria bacterium]